MISAIIMEISLFKQITRKIRILPFSCLISVKKNEMFIVDIGRVHNQYLKCELLLVVK